MMKRIFPIILLILCSLFFPGKTLGQNDIDEIKLKEFLNDYQDYSMLYQWVWDYNDRGEDIEILQEIPDNLTQFKGLLFDGCILYFDLDTSQYIQYTASEYFKSYKEFLINSDIRIQSSEIRDFKIVSTRPGGVILVALTKTTYYDPRLFDRPLNPSVPMLEIASDLVFTLFYDCIDQKYKLLKIDKNEHPFSDGLGSSKFIPQSLSFKASYLTNLFNKDLISDIKGNGYDFSLKANYLLGGSSNKNRFNLFLSPGIKFYHNKFIYSRNSLALPDITQIDQDQQEFVLLIDGEKLEQQGAVNYFGIPVDLKLFWKPGAINFSFDAGLMYSFPINSKFVINEADMRYRGRYELPQPPDPDFGQHTFIFENLPEYGFMNYSKDDFTGIGEVELNQLLSGHIGVNVGYDIDPRWRIELGADLYTGFGNMIKNQSVDSLINGNEFICPNLLVYEDNLKNASISFGVNLTYNLKRTNIPFRPNLKVKDIDDNICQKTKTSICGNLEETSIKSSKISIQLFLENDYELPTKTKSYRYNYCGVTKSNSQKGKIKLGKEYKLNLDVPSDINKTPKVQFAIRKPYMVDVYKDSTSLDTDNEYFTLNYSEMKTLSNKGTLSLYARDIPEIDIYYVSIYADPKSGRGDPDYNPMDFKSWLYSYIMNESRKNVNDVLLYCAYKDEKSAELTTSEMSATVQDFCDMVYDFKPNGIFNDIVTFNNVLNDIPCNRRNVNLYFVLNSALTYIDQDLNMTTDIVLKILEDKFNDNYENVNVKIILPYDDKNYKHIENTELKNIYERNKKPINVFDFEFQNYYNVNK